MSKGDSIAKRFLGHAVAQPPVVLSEKPKTIEPAEPAIGKETEQIEVRHVDPGDALAEAAARMEEAFPDAVFVGIRNPQEQSLDEWRAEQIPPVALPPELIALQQQGWPPYRLYQLATLLNSGVRLKMVRGDHVVIAAPPGGVMSCFWKEEN